MKLSERFFVLITLLSAALGLSIGMLSQMLYWMMAGVFLLVVGMSYWMPLVRVVTIPDNEARVVKSRHGRFVRVLTRTGIHFLWGWNEDKQSIDTLFYGVEVVIDDLKSADGVKHQITMSVGAKLDPDSASQDNLKSLVELMTPAKVKGITKGKVEAAAREVLGRYTVFELSNGARTLELGDEVCDKAVEKLSFFGITPFNVAIGGIQPPSEVQVALAQSGADYIDNITFATRLDIRQEALGTKTPREQLVLREFEELDVRRRHPGNSSYWRMRQDNLAQLEDLDELIMPIEPEQVRPRTHA